MKKIVVLSGAGMSAESGIKTFRDANGLWENHDVMDVASIEGWHRNPKLVLEFYNQRRRQLKEVEPNAAHLALVELEQHYDLSIVTQNVDDLHERAGSSRVIHLHGELRKVRSSKDAAYVQYTEEDLYLGQKCPQGSQMRPHIVWFGEAVPMMDEAAQEVYQADHIMIIGTSMQVYPAAGLVSFAQTNTTIDYIDPNPSLNYELQQTRNLRVIDEVATTGVRTAVDELLAGF